MSSAGDRACLPRAPIHEPPNPGWTAASPTQCKLRFDAVDAWGESAGVEGDHALRNDARASPITQFDVQLDKLLLPLSLPGGSVG